jgi:transcriptional regulatory protein RtcR
MATLAAGGRISVDLVDEEIARLRRAWQSPAQSPESDDAPRIIGAKRWEELDLFDRIQLRGVIQVCRDSKTLSDAGRKLFGSKSPNTAVTGAT